MDQLYDEVLHGEVLSEPARRHRRTLLGLTLVAVAFAAGMIPKKISALGIEFDQADQATLALLLAAIALYFLVVFCVRAWSDAHSWQSRYASVRLEQGEKDAAARGGGGPGSQPTGYYDRNRIGQEAVESVHEGFFAEPAVRWRIGTEVVLPAALGLLGLVLATIVFFNPPDSAPSEAVAVSPPAAPDGVRQE